jgi:hypothetical protein
MLFVFHHPTGLPSALSLSFLSYRSEKSSLDYYTIKIHDKKNIIQFVETKKKKKKTWADAKRNLFWEGRDQIVWLWLLATSQPIFCKEKITDL